MSNKIAVASGKGGTGKTTVAINLFYQLSSRSGKKVKLVDCDVEEPNDMLFFPEAKQVKQIEVTQQIPVIDTGSCTYCKKCDDYCEFNAITIIKNREFAEINPNLCHSCGACVVACPTNAITEHPKKIGTITQFKTEQNELIDEGRLEVGSAMQTMVIKKLKKSTENSADILIYDAPPGTSCPVTETISDVDYVILVAEPTKFGVYDLKLMTGLMANLNKPFGVVVNKAGIGNNEIYTFLKDQKIDLIGKIPFDRGYASSYAKGQLNEHPEQIEKSYQQISESIIKRLV